MSEYLNDAPKAAAGFSERQNPRQNPGCTHGTPSGHLSGRGKTRDEVTAPQPGSAGIPATGKEGGPTNSPKSHCARSAVKKAR